VGSRDANKGRSLRLLEISREEKRDCGAWNSGLRLDRSEKDPGKAIPENWDGGPNSDSLDGSPRLLRLKGLFGGINKG